MSAEVIGKNVKSFVIKSVQCIVESRLGGSKVRTVGRPTGKEWFYIALNDYPDVTEITKRALQTIVDECDDFSVNLQLIQNDWKICCEILLKTNDGETITLEYWTIENRTLTSDQSANNNLPTDQTSTLFHSYNQMSILLKSIISLSRALPAHKITENQSAESYVICYRVYKCDTTLEQLLNKDEIGCYSGPHLIGSVRTDYNKMDVSTAYRTEMRASRHRSHGQTETSARRTSLADRSDHPQAPCTSPDVLQLKSDHFTSEQRNKDRKRDRPLFAAFATTPSDLIAFPKLAGDAFNTLLPSNRSDEFTMESGVAHSIDNPTGNQIHSDPIQIPDRSFANQSDSSPNMRRNCITPTDHSPVNQSATISAQNLAQKNTCHLSCSPGCSSLDSFVFVDLKPPFAPDDQSELGSFFNGPAPSFGDCNLAEEVEDLNTQLEIMENDAQLWDDFFNSINSAIDETLENK